MNPPVVSVVMVISNVERFLSEAMESVLNQTFRDFEFIILDYGSTDKSKDIVLNYAAKDDRIKLHTAPPCTYIEAKIAACKLAQGRYIAIQDADDNSLPDRLHLEVNFMENNPSVGVLGGAADWINADGKLLFVYQTPSSDEEIRTALLKSSPFVHSSILLRREVYTQVGGYRIPHAEDYDLYLRISEHFQCANLKQVVVQYRVHPGQFSLRTREQQTSARVAARAAANVRRTGGVDPLDSVRSISESFLLELGVTPAQVQAELFLWSRSWVQNMLQAGERSAALNTAIEVLETDWCDVDRDQIADLRLLVARLAWKEKRPFTSFRAACHAVATKPSMAGELFRSLLRKVGFA